MNKSSDYDRRFYNLFRWIATGFCFLVKHEKARWLLKTKRILILNLYRPSPITHHPSPITYRPSPITHHPSPITHHPSSITHHPSPITHRPSPLLSLSDAIPTLLWLRALMCLVIHVFLRGSSHLWLRAISRPSY